MNGILKDRKTGQAIIIAPSALLTSASIPTKVDQVLRRCERQYLLVQTRMRVTHDGGASVLVVDDDGDDNE